MNAEGTATQRIAEVFEARTYNRQSVADLSEVSCQAISEAALCGSVTHGNKAIEPTDHGVFRNFPQPLTSSNIGPSLRLTSGGVLPAKQSGSPGEAATETAHQKGITTFDSTSSERFIDHDRH